MHGQWAGRDVRACPVCGGQTWKVRFEAAIGTVSAGGFVPSSRQFGEVTSEVVQCVACSHGSLRELPSAREVEAAYHEAEDPVSLVEEPGQLATADRDLTGLEGHVRPGRLVDLGCWTGSFLVAAEKRGWQVEGVEPSQWAAARARERGITVHETTIEAVELPAGAFRAVAACDVFEHLFDPGQTLDRIHRALEPDGALFVTVPDAGSPLARAMGRRWWAVVPMHLQYFTRRSMRLLLERHGFAVSDVRTHPKVFSAGYYADRLSTLAPRPGRVVRSLLERTGSTDRAVAPDFRDRMAVVARRMDG